MRKSNRFITFFAAMVLLCSPCALAKKNIHKPSKTFLNFIVRGSEKYENPELKEKLSKIKNASQATKTSETDDSFKKYDLAANERNLVESCFAWLAVVLLCVIIIKILFANFKIPFDYDPNFKNKHISKRKTGNKKYYFQKR
ncbi:MAG: hypothetical protein IKE05_02385 [Clostridia bacterium]|nr:hypothetical protein [Clostridia bacterium]